MQPDHSGFLERLVDQGPVGNGPLGERRRRRGQIRLDLQRLGHGHGFGECFGLVRFVRFGRTDRTGRIDRVGSIGVSSRHHGLAMAQRFLDETGFVL